MKTLVGIPDGVQLADDMEIVDGLVKRWCFGGPTYERDGVTRNGCGHYITTREDTWDTDNCDAMDDKLDVGTDNRTQELIVENLVHQVHCATCLQHDNSYLFAAWYDISEEDVMHLVDLYIANYPDDLQQPIFFAWDDKGIRMRLPKTHDVTNENDGMISLEDMKVKFYTCLGHPPLGEDDEGAGTGMWEWDTNEFDLFRASEWERMLEVFPQEKLANEE